jgi:hypothetical protein
MVFDGGIVACFGGVDFGGESAEEYMFSLEGNRGNPFADAFVERDADEMRVGFFQGFSLIEHILGMSCEAKVFSSIIKAIIISVVNEKTFWRVQYFPVQRYNFHSLTGVHNQPNGIDIPVILLNAPLVIIERVEVRLVNNGEFVLAQINPAKGVTIFESPIDHHRPDKNTV